jgi:hypothetical protein
MNLSSLNDSIIRDESSLVGSEIWNLNGSLSQAEQGVDGLDDKDTRKDKYLSEIF